MPRSFFTISFLFAFLITAASLQWWQLPQYPVQVWIVLGFLGVLLLYVSLMARLASLRMDYFVLLFVVLCGASFSFLRIAQTTHVTLPEHIEAYAAGEKVTLRGVITDEPDRRPMKTKYTVEVSGVRRPSTSPSARPADAGLARDSAQDDMFIHVQGRVLVTDYAAWPRHSYGDEVLVTGILERPTQIEDFHYDRYLSRYGIFSVMYRARIETLSSGHGNSFFTYLYNLKERFEAQLNRLYPEPHASFMAGLLTGSRRGIPEHLLKDFQATGLTHIIAISGYNISIVLVVVSSFLFFLPLKWRFLPAMIAIISFTFFVGASPSVVRAAIMGGLGLFALQAGRQTHSLISILLAAALMTAWNPKVLWYDAGFQLSFLSVLGLSYLAPFLDRLFARVPRTLALRESLQMTVAAQLAAVPLVVILFSQFSLVAPLTNVLVAPLIPAAMLFGFLGTFVSFFSFPLGLLIAYLGWAALELIIRITQFFADFPYALLQVSDSAAQYVWWYYAVLLLVMSLPLIQKHTRSFFLRRSYEIP